MFKRLEIFLFAFLLFSSSFVFGQLPKEIKLKVSDGLLAGTLLNINKQEGAPVALIVPGSGALDRNGNSGFLQGNTYLFLAKRLAEFGINSLRYDKFGAGGSKMSIQERDYTIDNEVNHVVAWINYLKKAGFTNIIVIGHSEGSLTGMLAAQKEKIAKFISLEGAGRPIDVVLKEQLSVQLKGKPELLKEANKTIDQLKKGDTVGKVSPLLNSLFRPSVQPYLISWMKYNPSQEIAKLSIPVMIVQGSTDLQVTMEDAEALKKGKEDAQFTVIHSMNHILKKASPKRQENLNTYYDSKLPIMSLLIEELTAFIKK